MKLKTARTIDILMKFFGYIGESWILTLAYSGGKNVTEVGEGVQNSLCYSFAYPLNRIVTLCAPHRYWSYKDKKTGMDCLQPYNCSSFSLLKKIKNLTHLSILMSQSFGAARIFGSFSKSLK